MCGRLTFYDEVKLGQDFDVDLMIKPSYNSAPGIQHPILHFENGKFVVEPMRWGLVPSWARDPMIGYHMINARAETVQDKPSFRGPLKTKRCLVPANGFYEWDKLHKTKTPFYFTLKKEPAFFMAGMFDIWKDGSGRAMKSFTIVTTKANTLVGKIHDRMPVIFTKQEAKAWIKDEYHEGLLTLLRPYPTSKMNVWRVSTLVNKPINNTPEVIQKVTA